MKQPRFATSPRPSRLCHYFFLVLLCKLFILGSMIFAPTLPNVSLWHETTTSSQSHPLAAGVAYAAETEPLAAPPSISNTTPDVGMNVPPSGKATPGIPSGNNRKNFSPDAPDESPLPMVEPRDTSRTNGTAQETNLERDLLNRKQAELTRKEQELRTLENEISQKLEKMEILENRLTVMMEDAKDIDNAKFRHLVDMLSNMKAKAAAQVLETMDPRTAVRVLAGMRGRQAGEILSNVKPEVAANLTQALTKMQLPLE